MKEKLFVIACGGTGGHLTPGIALAEEFLSRGHKCVLIISKKLVDQKLCSAYPHITFIKFPGVGFSKNIFALPKFIYFLFKNFFKAICLLKRLQPVAVIGFGGFTNASVVLSAYLLRKPCFLHEANQVIGKTIRYLSRIATKVYLPEGVLLNSISSHKQETFGFPLRKEFQKKDKNASRKQLNIDCHQKLLVVLGGSQGALCLNKWVLDHLKPLAEHNINVICVTGIGKNPQQMVEVPQEENASKVIFLPFSNNVSVLLSAADLVIGRAGAGTIAELTQCETPSILVPYPQAADNHQLANALALEQKGGCLVLEQKHMYRLLDETLHLIFNDDLLNDMRYQLKHIASVNVAHKLADDIEAHLSKSFTLPDLELEN
jgi:UDP-N-acetylglucosamine--N-acetylmuramyl-(pentapeptide) pyrophosphoryl-undecaprenol N-acetylglucosamine transferase